MITYFDIFIKDVERTDCLFGYGNERLGVYFWSDRHVHGNSGLVDGMAWYLTLTSHWHRIREFGYQKSLGDVCLGCQQIPGTYM